MAIGSLVERASRYARLSHLPTSHGVESVRDALIGVLASLPQAARRTLIWDKGSEMAFHDPDRAAAVRGRVLRPPRQPLAAGDE